MDRLCKWQLVLLICLVSFSSHARIPDPPWTPSPDAQQQFLLFALDPQSPSCSGCAVIEPILWFQKYQQQTIPYSSDLQNPDAESKAFIDRFLKSGQRYKLAGAAAPLPEVTVDRLVQTTCLSLGATLQESSVLSPGQKHVVSNVNLLSFQDTWEDYLYASHLQTIRKRVETEFLQKMPAGQVSDLQVVNRHVVKNKSQKPNWLLVEYRAQKHIQPGSDCCFASLVVYDLFTGKTQLQNTRNADFSYLGFEFLDAVDLDANGVAELVFRERLYEVDTYFIYKFKNESWGLVATSEGGGC